MNWQKTFLVAASLGTSLVASLAAVPAYAADRISLSDVPAGIAESPDPSPPEPVVEVTLPDGHVVVMDESSHPVPGQAVVGPPTAGEPCFPSKEEYLDAWDATGEPPPPVFCSPTSP